MIDLNKKEVIEVKANGMIIQLTAIEDDTIYVNFESEEGGRTIRIKPHEEDKKTLVFSIDKKKPTFSVVK